MIHKIPPRPTIASSKEINAAGGCRWFIPSLRLFKFLLAVVVCLHHAL